MVAKVRMFVLIGERVSLIGTTLLLFTFLALLALDSVSLEAAVQGGARCSEPEQKSKSLTVASCGALLLGLVLFFFADYVHVTNKGVAGTLISPTGFAGRNLSSASPPLAGYLFLTCFLAPLLQVFAVLMGFVPKFAALTWRRAAAEVGSAFNCVDIFTVAYLSFLLGVNGFVESSTHDSLKPICELAQKAVGEDCIMIQARMAPVGFIGMSLATAGTWVLLFVLNADSLRRRDSCRELSTSLHQANSSRTRSEVTTFNTAEEES